jgi:hypothetical protein
MPSHDLLAIEIDDDDMLRAYLLETKAVRLHKDAILAGNPHRDMPKNIIPVSFMGEYITRVG